MGYLSYLNQQDITFLKALFDDIAKELCGCDCCKKETGCSIFERMYIGGNILYKKVEYSFSNDTIYDNYQSVIKALYDNNGDIYTGFTFTQPSDIDYNTLTIGTNVFDEEGNTYEDQNNKIYDENHLLVNNGTDIYVIKSEDLCGKNINLFADESCIDWGTISKRINIESSKKNKFVDRSRSKLLSRFYKYIYDFINNTDNNKISKADSNYCDLDISIFENATDIIENCLDECCN